VALRSIRESIQPAAPPWYKAIYDAFKLAQENVVSAAARGNTPSMGTTAVCALVDGGQAWVGWIGDSRLYVFRDGHVVVQSSDHTRVREMVDRGILTPEQAKVHPDAHILTRVIGGGAPDGFKPEVWKEPVDLAPGDVVLLCSDGLYDLLSEREIYQTIAGLDCAAAPRALVDAANERGGFDNISVALAVAGSSVIQTFPQASRAIETNANFSEGEPSASASAAAAPLDAATPAVTNETLPKAEAAARQITIHNMGTIGVAIGLIIVVGLVAYLVMSSFGGRRAPAGTGADPPASGAKISD
jgi:serine/threonine protein phosphatase PrpC